MAVIEADERMGGRVRQSTTFLDSGHPVELGPEFLHGDSTSLRRWPGITMGLARTIYMGAGDGGPSEAPARDGGIGYYWLGRDRKLARFDELPQDIQNVHEMRGNSARKRRRRKKKKKKKKIEMVQR